MCFKKKVLTTVGTPTWHVKSCSEEGKSKNGPVKNQSSTTPEDREALTLSIGKMESMRKPKNANETGSETTGSHKIQKTTQSYIVEAHDSTRKRLEDMLPREREDPIAEKGFNSIHPYSLLRKFVSVLQAMKNPDAKEALVKE